MTSPPEPAPPEGSVIASDNVIETAIPPVASVSYRSGGTFTAKPLKVRVAGVWS